MHTHPSYAAYIFEACKVKFTFPDGTTHQVEVLGNTDLHVLHIDVK
jgi:hypothetical protein